MRPLRRIAAVGLVMSSFRESGATEFTLGFEGCPVEVVGTAGEVKAVDVFATLTTSNNPSTSGVYAWFINVTADEGTITAIARDGVMVSTIFDHDGDPATPPLDPYVFDLGASEVWLSGETRSPDGIRMGRGASVVLSMTRLHELQPNGTQRIARLTIEAMVPSEVTLRYADGFRFFPEDFPILNDVFMNPGGFALPSKETCLIRFGTKSLGGAQLPGDCNQDGTVDISDAICIFGVLFLGIPAAFPCAVGSPESDGNVALLDWQPDGEVDLSDGVGLLQYLFSTGPPHGLGTDCTPIVDCGDACRAGA